MKTTLIASLVALAATFTLASNVRAQTYASDDFSSYSVGTSYTSTSTPSSDGGTGFSSGWSVSSYDGLSTGTATVVSGLSLSDLDTSGNALEITSADGSAVSFGRTLGATIPTDGTFWGSYVFEQQSLYSGEQYNSIPVTSGVDFNADSTNREYFANALDDQQYNSNDYADIGIYKNPDATGTYPGQNLITGQAYFVVFEFQNINYGPFTNNDSKESLWVLNQANLTAINGNFTTANLNANNQIALSYDVGAGNETYGTPQFSSTSTFNLIGQSGTSEFGDINLGATLADVAQYNPQAVPEPSTSALLAAGFLTLVVLLRKRSSKV